MAQNERTAAEFVLWAFRPRVAVMPTAEVEAVCQKNNLSLTEMLQPFSKLQTDAQLRDPLGAQVSVRGLRLSLEDWQVAPPPAPLARRLLSESVAQNLPPPPPEEGGAVPPRTPWFEAWRERLLQVEPPGEHEFSRRFVACVLAASSSAAAPLQQLRQLAQQQHQLQHGQPAGGHRWFSNNVLIYYLLVTDVGVVQEASAEAMFEEIRSAFGAHCCHHLRLNSRPPEHREPHVPDPWAEHVAARLTNTEAAPSRRSGGDTPAEVAQLTALPSLVVEAAPDHPLSPESRTSSPPPPPPVPPEPVPAATEAAESGTPAVAEDAASGVVLNRVNYPPPLPPGTAAAAASQGHGACLSASDLDRLSIFVSELCVRGLLPHVERQLRALSDVVNNRKGMSRSLLSATKRWFGGNKPGAAAAVTSVIYSQEAPEIQVRRLGDLAFMFCHYDLAYQAYHTAKRDFSGDSAWLHFAGALEMAALSVFLHAGAAKPFPQHYLDQSISTYLDSCRVPEYALRATLFSTECLKARGQWAEAALQFIRLTAEEADLRSALLLEQAAHCFLNSQPPALRKYAFHMILSGHRFSKAGQRRHSLRAYKQAAQVYEGHGWRLADDHIAFTLGRHAEALQEHGSALRSLERVLSSATAEAPQAAAQQAALLREYLHLHKQQGATPPSLPTLPLPTLLAQQTRVLVSEEQRPAADGWSPASGSNFTDDEDDNSRWFRLEELCVETMGLGAALFRPTLQCLTAKTDNVAAPRLAAGEPMRVQLVLRNPLRVPLELADLRLQFSFEPRSTDGSASEQQAHLVAAQTLPRCLLEETSTQEVTLSLTPSLPGRLTVLGYEYSLGLAAAEPTVQPQQPALTVRGCQPISVRGRRLYGTKEERARVMHAEDKRLQISVEEPGARLQVAFRGMPSSLLCGQIQPILLRVTNTGLRPVSRLLLATPEPLLVVLETEPPPEEDRWRQVRPAAARRCWAEAAPPGPVWELPLPAGGLPPAGSVTRRLWLRAPQTEGARPLELLLCWRDGGARPRLLRHAGRLLVAPSLGLAVRTGRSAGPSARLQVELEVSGLQAGTAPLLLETVALAAYRWRLHSSDSPPPATSVLRGQTAYLGVAAERVPEQPTVAAQSQLELTAAHLDTEQSAVSGCPTAEFLLRHRAPPPAAAGTGGASEAAALAAAVTVDATVLLLWRTQGVDAAGVQTTLYGQHQVTAETLGVGTATYAAVIGGSTEPEPRPPVTILSVSGTEPPPPHWPGEGVLDRLVSFSPLHRPEVTHDFSRRRLCVIPVTMLVRNHSSCDLVVHLSAVSAGTSAPRTVLPYSCHVSGELVWVGRTHPYVTVPAGGAARLRLAAAVARPGLYDLGSVGVACRRVGGADSELTEQTARVESAVLVRDVTDVGGP